MKDRKEGSRVRRRRKSIRDIYDQTDRLVESGRLTPEQEERVYDARDKYEQNILEQPEIRDKYSKAVRAYVAGDRQAKRMLDRIANTKYSPRAYRDGYSEFNLTKGERNVTMRSIAMGNSNS